MAGTKEKPIQLISRFTVHPRCIRSEDGTVVLGWTGWFLKSDYKAELPVNDGDVKDIRLEFPDSPWDHATDTNAKFTIDDTYVTIGATCEYTLRMAINYLLRIMAGIKNNANVTLKRTWEFNAYKGPDISDPVYDPYPAGGLGFCAYDDDW